MAEFKKENQEVYEMIIKKIKKDKIEVIEHSLIEVYKNYIKERLVVFCNEKKYKVSIIFKEDIWEWKGNLRKEVFFNVIIGKNSIGISENILLYESKILEEKIRNIIRLIRKALEENIV